MFQGDRARNVGVVDSEFIVHLGLPTLGVMDQNKVGTFVFIIAPDAEYTNSKYFLHFRIVATN